MRVTRKPREYEIDPQELIGLLAWFVHVGPEGRGVQIDPKSIKLTAGQQALTHGLSFTELLEESSQEYGVPAPEGPNEGEEEIPEFAQCGATRTIHDQDGRARVAICTQALGHAGLHQCGRTLFRSDVEAAEIEATARAFQERPLPQLCGVELGGQGKRVVCHLLPGHEGQHEGLIAILFSSREDAPACGSDEAQEPEENEVCGATRSIGGGCMGYPDLVCQRQPGHEGEHRDGRDEWVDRESEARPQGTGRPLCGEANPGNPGRYCDLDAGHEGIHQDQNGSTWVPKPCGATYQGEHSTHVCRLRASHDGAHRDGSYEWPRQVALCGDFWPGDGLGRPAYTCDRLAGHDGPHGEGPPMVGVQWSREKVRLQAPIEPCGFTAYAGGQALTCTLRKGHSGSHGALVCGAPYSCPAQLDDSDPYTYSCTLPFGHEGPHQQEGAVGVQW